MNKAELVETVAAEVGLTKKDVNNVVEAMTSAITTSLGRGEKVTLVGFGTFTIQRRKARRGVSPITRMPISISAKEVPKFSPGRNLREAVYEVQGTLFVKDRQAQGKALQKMEQEALRNLRKGKTIPLGKVRDELQNRV